MAAVLRVLATHNVLKALQARQSRLRYRDRTKPFNFLLLPILDPIGGYPPRVAVNPMNAILNYTYAILEAETSLAHCGYGPRSRNGTASRR